MTLRSQDHDTPREGFAASVTSRPNPPLWWALAQIVAIAFHMPLSVLSGTQRALASSASVIAVGLGVSVALTVTYLVVKRFISGWRALAVASAVGLLFWHSSGFTQQWMLRVAFAILIIGAAYRFADHRIFKVAVFVGSVALAATLLILALTDTLTEPAPIVAVTDPITTAEFQMTPDIYLILLDGYGRADVLKDRYDFDNSKFLNELSKRGFDVSEASTSNYTITHLSLPSLLNMSYMNEPNDYMNNSDLVALADAVSGDNALVDVLKNAGYEYVHGDTDHWFNTCGPSVDVCLPGPVLDVSGYTLLADTPIGGLLYPESGDPTTALNRARIDQMSNWAAENPSVSEPNFTFLHLVLPHPPLFLDAHCQVREDDDLRGRILNSEDVDVEQLQKRKTAWVEQVQCANLAVLDFLEQVDDNAIVVVTSDHGPDADFTIQTGDPADLSQEALQERLPNLAAVRMPQDCDEAPRDVQSVNLMRVVLECITSSDVPMLPSRHFAASFGGSIVELKFLDPLADQ